MSAAENSPTGRVDIAIAVVEREGKYLVGLRPEGLPLAGYWEFPGGKVAHGETPQDAARRECLEETGLAVRITGSYPSATHDYPHGQVRLRFVACAPEEQQRPLPPRFRWVPAAELHNYKFPPANDDLLQRLTGSKTN